MVTTNLLTTNMLLNIPFDITFWFKQVYIEVAGIKLLSHLGIPHLNFFLIDRVIVQKHKRIHRGTGSGDMNMCIILIN